MKSLILSLIVVLSCLSGVQAQKIERSLQPFSEIKVGPGINVKLIKSNHHRIEITSDSELVNDLVIDDSHDELKVYFDYSNFSFDDDSDIANSKYSLENTPYEGIEVYAKLYFTELKSIDFRGENKLFTKDILTNHDLLIKSYGENEMAIQGVECSKLTIKTYGENELQIFSGRSGDISIKTYGENEIKIAGIVAETASLWSMGESDIDIHAMSQLKVRIFGEGNIRYKGNPRIKEFNLGEASIARLD